MHNVVLFSGGLDSTACLNHVIRSRGREKVTALTILYGSTHNHQELAHARSIAKVLDVEWVLINLPEEIFKYSGSALMGEAAIPDGEYRKEGPQDTVVPFRNGTMLAIAAAIAYRYETTQIWIAVHQDDIAGYAYPDCSPEFILAMDKAMVIATLGKVSIVAPFVMSTKRQIVLQGARELAPLELSYSCYAGTERHCGMCATCIDRHDAFRLAGFNDPTEYSIEYREPRITLQTYPTLDKE